MGLYKKHGIILSIFLACGMFVRLDSSQTSSRNRPSNKQPELEILVAELNTLWPNLNEKIGKLLALLSEDSNLPEDSREGLKILESTLESLRLLNARLHNYTVKFPHGFNRNRRI